MLDRKKILNRFLSYVKIDTESDPNSTTTPSTEKQWTLARLLAEELKIAHESLCEITGEFSSDDLLGEIFSSFCIGK